VDFKPTRVEEVETEYSRRLKTNRAEHYLQCHIRIDDIRAATRLGGSSLALLLLIYYRRDVTREEAVTLPSELLAGFGIDRSSKHRGLKGLEQAKLIKVKRTVGHTAVIELCKRKGRTAERRVTR
jgi:DNA-binding MarR family transcriptional regulator